MVLSPKGRGSLVIFRKYVIYCDTTGSVIDGYRYGGGRQVAGDGGGGIININIVFLGIGILETM
jgi:hypothetical protein